MSARRGGVVSVVIPCYNQARFLGEAIESVLAQSYPRFEIVVVDDGSIDDTCEVAARYPSVRCIRQDNQGLSAARNAGLRESEGEYVVFLDADDRLLPEALEVGLRCLKEHPECAFVAGHCTLISSDGSLLKKWNIPCIGGDLYLTLLSREHFVVPAAVMYQRYVFATVGGFNISIKASEDYDLYFRIAKRFPVYWHNIVVVEHRLHDANMTRDSVLMLKNTLTVLRSQWPYVKGNERYEVALKMGIRRSHEEYGNILDRPVAQRIRGLVSTALRPESVVVVFGKGNNEESVKLDRQQVWTFVAPTENSGPEQLFAGGTKGTREAAWISTGMMYPFRLYAGLERKTLLAAVNVTRGDEPTSSAALPDQESPPSDGAFIRAIPNPVPTGEDVHGTTTISWSTSDGSEAQVYLGEPLSTKAQYPTDSAEAIVRLEELRNEGADFLLLPVTALWWLELYPEFERHLEERYRAVALEEDVCHIYQLREQNAASEQTR